MATDNGGSAGDGGGRSRRERRRVIAAVALGVLMLAFVLDNRTPVKIGFVLFDVHVRLIWVLVGTFVLGAVVGQLIVRRRAGHKAKE